MRRYTDAELEILHDSAISYANKHTTSGAEISNSTSNLIIIELLNRMLEK